MNQGLTFLIEFFNRIPPSLYTELISFYEIRDCQFHRALNLGVTSPSLREVEILISRELRNPGLLVDNEVLQSKVKARYSRDSCKVSDYLNVEGSDNLPKILLEKNKSLVLKNLRTFGVQDAQRDARIE